ncbi:MAG: DNA polymerase Y family protein, partial [Thermoguttaceae bacterium]|nr:DNA polymerase Y family protein [Thermoguttaceae bacterium]
LVRKTPGRNAPPNEPPTADRQSLEALAQECLQFSPIVGVEEGPAPESLFLDITGLEHLFGGEAALAHEVQRCLVQRGFVVRVAIADTLGTAWAVAHFGMVESATEANHLRRPGTSQVDSKGPSPCRTEPVLVPPGATLVALRPLPVESLRLPDRIVALLHSLGLYRVGQLEPLPRAELAARFGPELVRRWDQAIGRLAEPVPVGQAPPKLAAKQSLEYPTTHRETIEAVFKQLLEHVAEMLIRAGRGAMRVQCRLECQQDQAIEFSVGLFEATVSARHLLDLVRVRLERVSLPSPVLGASVAVAETAPFHRRQGTLFPEGPARQHPRLLAALIDRLSNRLGYGSVLRARLVAEAQPELAYCYEPLVKATERRPVSNIAPLPLAGEGPGVRAASVTVPPGRRDPAAGEGPGVRAASVTVPPGRRDPAAGEGQAMRAKSPSFHLRRDDEKKLLPRPLRLISPIPVASVALLPDGPPIRFRWKGEEHRVAHLWGPERIETGWWRGPMIARDYYRVETTTGRRFWLFRCRRNGRWFLHGMFE